MKFEITTKEGGTLHTASKYCEEDINIIPKLQDKTITENGTVSADEGYAGLSKVNVAVKSNSGIQTTISIIPSGIVSYCTSVTSLTVKE